MEQNQNYLENVIGYKMIKEELKNIESWYKDNSKNKDTLPKGILFYGQPGTGKTLLMKEYAKSFGLKVFELVGTSSNLEEEIDNLYKEANKEELAIVVIDELDKLVRDDDRVSRILQTILDGYKSNKIITLATANYIDDIPESLLREGRFDRIFKLGNLEKEDVKDLIIKFLNDKNQTIENDDLSELIESFRYFRPTIIKQTIYDACNLVEDKLDAKFILNRFYVTHFDKFEDPNRVTINKEMAIHEAGHALYVYKYSKTQKFLRVKFSYEGGKTICVDDLDYENLDLRVEKIRTNLAGIIAEELILNYHNIGCGRDLDNAYDLSYRLINRTSINGIDNFVYNDDFVNKTNLSEKKKYLLEKRTNKYLKEQYRKTLKKLKRDQDLIMKLANFMITNKELTRKDIIALAN